MAVKVFTLGLSKIEVGNIADDGGMGTTLEQLGYTNKDSATLTMEVPEKTEFFAEEVDDPVLVSKKAGAITIAFDIMNPSPEVLQKVMGGTISKSEGSQENNKWEAPSTLQDIELSMKVTPKQGFVFDIPRASISANLTGNFAAGSLLLVHVEAKVLAPTKANTSKLTLTKLA
jgi:hypothetical protein